MEYISKSKTIMKPKLLKMGLFVSAHEDVRELLCAGSNSTPQFSLAKKMGYIMKTFFHHPMVTAPNCNIIIICSNDKVCSNTEFHTEESLWNLH